MSDLVALNARISQTMDKWKNINGKYLIKINGAYGFAQPDGDAIEDAIEYLRVFWTDKIHYHDDGSIEFEPIDIYSKLVWPKSINIHISNCCIYKMKEDE